MTEEAADDDRRLRIASWDDRFWAWLIDVLLVGTVVSAVAGALQFAWAASVGVLGVEWTINLGGANGLGMWLYWTALEGYTGQSAGKMALGIRVADKRGDPVDFVAAGIGAFGKAFLLPVDCLVGWLAMPGTGLRLFNRLSDTVVVEDDEEWQPDDVEYVYPGDE